MGLNDPAGDRKSKAGPVRFVSDKWLEDSLLIFGSDTATVVPDLDMQRICLETDRECNDWLLGIRSLFVQCITGIAKKIQNCLTELYGICRYFRKVLGNAGNKFDICINNRSSEG